MSVVAVRNLCTRRGSTEVLRGIDLDVRGGEVVAIVGASGSGKTTLLRALNYLTPFTAGSVEIAGHLLRPGMSERADAAALCAVRVRVGMVFQSFHLFPHLTALENVMEAPRQVLGLSALEASSRARALLGRVGLDGFGDAYPERLSGGQQQRVAIARALAMEPKLMLLDEITSALDPQLVAEVLTLVRELAETGMTMIIATHEMSFAREVANKVCFLDEGVISEEGPPEQIFSAPQQPRTREFLARVLAAGRL
jgi:polar amino acid transport system ATP-binding protein